MWAAMLLAIYAGLGLVFAVPFVVRFAERMDPAAKGAGFFFRLLILPGSIALWPVLLNRLRKDASHG